VAPPRRRRGARRADRLGAGDGGDARRRVLGLLLTAAA
jgi:hypothetical protein